MAEDVGCGWKLVWISIDEITGKLLLLRLLAVLGSWNLLDIDAGDPWITMNLIPSQDDLIVVHEIGMRTHRVADRADWILSRLVSHRFLRLWSPDEDDSKIECNQFRVDLLEY